MTVTTPAGVPASVTVRAKKTRVLAKSPRGKSATFKVATRAGAVRIAGPPITVDGAAYRATVSRPRLTLRKGATVRVRVAYSALPGAKRLRATEIGAMQIALEWDASTHARVQLRRTPGEHAARTVRQGTRVATKQGSAVDTGLTSGARYSYALFTKTKKVWTGPIAVVATTVSSDPRVAAYVAPPSTVIVGPGDADKPSVEGGGVSVRLAPGRDTPLAGAGFVLPVSAALPTGYLGTVESLSADGRTVHLVGAGLADAFEFYKIDVDLATIDPIALRPRAAGAAGSAARDHNRRTEPRNCLTVTSEGSIVLHPIIRPAGHFRSSIVRWHRLPVAATFDMAVQLELGLSADFDVDATISCRMQYEPVITQIATAPVPIAAVLEPIVEVGVAGQMSATNVGYTVTGGFWVKGEIGSRNWADGGLIAKAGPTATSYRYGFEANLSLGGELTVGPGAGTHAAGAVAGVGGKLFPIVAAFSPEFDPADARHDACIATTLGVEAELNLNAKAWIGRWNIGASLTVDALRRSADYAGSPWFLAAGCDKLPASDGGGGAGGAGGGGGGGGGGSDPPAPPSPPPPPVDYWSTISAGPGYHTCAVAGLSRRAACWGYNGYRQLGDGTTSDRWTPVLVQDVFDVTSVSAGSRHSCALEQSGHIACWGLNNYGQLGDATTLKRSYAVSVQGVSDASAISAGDEHACALRLTGQVACWGYNAFGQLGDGTTTSQSSAVAVQGLSDAIAISAASNYTCALRRGGQVSCWGINVDGQLGNGTHTDSPEPVPVRELTDATALSAAGSGTCALRESGQPVCWGYNAYGMLGDGTATSQSSPVMVQGVSDARTISKGVWHACAVRRSGAVACWGENSFGTLGNGTTDTGLSTVQGLHDPAAISTGDMDSCALRQDGQMACWGYNTYGQLGDGTTTARMTPVTVIGPP